MMFYLKLKIGIYRALFYQLTLKNHLILSHGIFTFENNSSDLDSTKPEEIKKRFGLLSNLLKRCVWDHITQRKRNS